MHMELKYTGNTVETFCLSGDDWQICKADSMRMLPDSDSQWIAAAVPGNVQADLEKARLLLPLWYGMGDPNLMDACLTGWWYRKSFRYDGDCRSRQTIRFDGVDYAADIYMNSTHVKHIEGMFIRYAVDVTGLIRQGENELLVYIHPMPEKLLPWLQNSDGRQSGVDTEYHFVQANNQIRQTLKGLKSPANCSYDWGTNIYTLGIWKDVFLEMTGCVRISYLHASTEFAENGAAIVKVCLETDSTKKTDVLVRWRITGPDMQTWLSSSNSTLQKGAACVLAEIEVSDPQLWWPAGHGDQPLYGLEASVFGPDGKLLCVKNERFGIREIRWELTDGAPEGFPNPFALLVNGRRIRTMGSNIVSPDLLPGRIGKRGRHFIEMARRCGMNTLRQHGGQVIDPQSMYDAADELGIMLLVDFPMGNCVPENEPVFLQNLQTTVADIVKQLKNHPSIIEWSGGNELEWYFNPESDHTALRLMEQMVSDTDETRIFRATCPVAGSRHAPWVYNPELTYKEFNRDITDNFGKIPMMRYGEFGCQTPSNLEEWLRDIPKASRWPISVDDPVLIRKNAVEAVFDRNTWLCLPVIEELFGPMDGIENTIRAGQFLGAEGLRYQMDALRAMGKKLGGFTNWDYNEPWPNGAGSFLVDYDGVTVMQYHYARQALAPVTLQLKYDSPKFSFFGHTVLPLRLVSDSPQRICGLHWNAVLRDRFGKVYGQRHGRADADPVSAVWLDDIDITPPESVKMGPVFCELELMDNEKQRLTERIYVFVPEGVAHPMRGLLFDVPDRPYGVPYVTTGMVPGRVKQTELRIVESGIVQKDGPALRMTLQNDGDMTALFIKADPICEYKPCLYVENEHCFIPPGERRELFVRCEDAGLPPELTGFRIKGWNTNEVYLHPAPEMLFYFGCRNRTCREFDTSPSAEVICEAVNRTVQADKIPYRVGPEKVTLFLDRSSMRSSVLRLSWSDTATHGCRLLLEIGEFTAQVILPCGYGIQNRNPEQLAQAGSVDVALPAGVLKAAKTAIKISAESGWMTWDSLALYETADR